MFQKRWFDELPASERAEVVRRSRGLSLQLVFSNLRRRLRGAIWEDVEPFTFEGADDDPWPLDKAQYVDWEGRDE